MVQYLFSCCWARLRSTKKIKISELLLLYGFFRLEANIMIPSLFRKIIEYMKNIGTTPIINNIKNKITIRDEKMYLKFFCLLLFYIELLFYFIENTLILKCFFELEN